MKPYHLLLAALLALSLPSAARADTVYFSKSGEHGIQSVSGTIVQETAGIVEILTDDGRTISILKSDVLQVVRGTPSTAAYTDFGTEDVHSPASYHFGIKGGANISNMSIDPQELEDDNSLQSYAIGMWWGFPISRRVTIQPEALYSVKGDSESSGGYTSSTRLGYIDVPVLAKIGFLRDASTRPSLYLGPLMAMNVSGRSKLEGEGTSIDIDVKDQIRAFEFGLVVGGGVDFLVGERTFGIDLRYSKGLSNFAGDEANGTGRNDVIAIMGSFGLQ